MTFTGVLLDLDDTLLVEEKSAETSFLEVALAVSDQWKIDPREFVPVIRECARSLWYSLPTFPYAKQMGIASWEALWADFSEINEDQKRLRGLKEYYQNTAWDNAMKHFNINDFRFAKDLAQKFRKIRRNKHVLFSDTIPFLTRILPYKLALVTNGSPDVQRIKLEKSGLAKYFSTITISAEIGYAKPTREIFEITLSQLKMRSDEVIMIGNSLKSDVRGAKVSNIFSVWVNREGVANTSRVEPDLEVSNLLKILDILEL
ncbi:MAG: metallopeptidase YsaA [Promethearchaeota archaeon CR_4]|nr:MAG: metallopeptidase YsaA [Candidatus Lokiarchaeota archaeon CR_4]